MVEKRESLVDLLGKEDNLNEPIPGINHREAILGVVITFMVLSWLCTCFRLYIRLIVVRTPGWDDFFLTLYLLSTSLGSIVICMLTDWGLGQHFLLLPLETMQGYLSRFYIANGSYSLSTTFVKLSLLFQYLRVFEATDVLMRRICIGFIVIVSLWGITFSCLNWIPCDHPAAVWDFSLAATSHCWAFNSPDPSAFAASYITHGSLNMVLDIIVFSIPIPLYFKHGTTHRTRMGLLVLLFMGSLVIFVSIWRLASIVEHKATTYPTFDPTWYVPISMVLSCVEVDLASMCASAPVFWPTLRDQVMKIFVTQEIAIIREDRSDEFEMHRTWTGHSGQEPVLGKKTHSSHSHQGSEVGLDITISEVEKGKDTKRHYEDRFIRGQVDPFSKELSVGASVQTSR
ncbi:hypothetical protein GQ53DRAFT_872620 [Thozetella sp. PMI_491]|nr:hypothetical protein GQ53DRAFT_872620 [Thozetella sp. PMI_491]